MARGDIIGITICKGAQTITHLLFADDGFLFFRESPRETEKTKAILDVYE